MTATVTEAKQNDQALEVIELKHDSDVEEVEKPKKHQLTKDKMLIRWAIIIFVLLCCSWAAQWTSIVIPYWRGDEYHVGGLFQICGNTKFTFDPVTKQIHPNRPHEWRCEKFEDYVDDFRTIFPDQNSEWYIQAGSAKKLIVVSRWFEALTTSFDMVFGATTIWAVIYPAVDPKQQKKNMIYALIGIILTPSFAVVDSFIQNSYWDSIGVGLFNKNIQTFLYAAGDIAWISSALDFGLQLGFLVFGIRRQYALARQGDEIAMRADAA
ncbi:UNVERIFIED_CONTAM: hypothetical protein HDU68_009870 [Siphonaria sp. JEL0065]|nr:hypothetical protein HDU68_009870 [Siphonaria sp. JEL0065]